MASNIRHRHACQLFSTRRSILRHAAEILLSVGSTILIIALTCGFGYLMYLLLLREMA